MGLPPKLQIDVRFGPIGAALTRADSRRYESAGFARNWSLFLLTHYQRAFSECRPYLLATRQVAPLLDTRPHGIDLHQTGLVLDPQARVNEPFLHLLQNLDRMTFGPLGMAMPKWVFYDCGVMPSAAFGFCGPARSLEPWVHRALDIPDRYDGMVPLSLFIAIPTVEKGAWFTHTLCSLNHACPGAAPAGLTLLSMAFGVRILPARILYGTSQWRSERLGSYVSFGPLEVVTAYTPAHSVRRTLTWRLHLQQFGVESALMKPGGVSPSAPPATHMLDVDDEEALIALQRDIERGVRVAIVGPPSTRGSIVQVPLRREEAR